MECIFQTNLVKVLFAFAYASFIEMKGEEFIGHITKFKMTYFLLLT